MKCDSVAMGMHKNPTHQPKGCMCFGCEKAASDCSSLPFKDMPVIGIDKTTGVKIVRCTDYIKKEHGQDSLPPLPPKRVIDRHLPTAVCIRGYNEQDMMDYAAIAVAAEREIQAKIRATWQPIETAPRDGTLILVNDTTPEYTLWVAASYFEGDDWQGWLYDDPLMADANPLGPNPTHWFSVPPLPGDDEQYKLVLRKNNKLTER